MTKKRHKLNKHQKKTQTQKNSKNNIKKLLKINEKKLSICLNYGSDDS